MKVFNCILGVFAMLGATYCMMFPGVTFLNNGWIVTIFLGVWGVCAIFEFFTKEKKEDRSKTEVAMGVISLIMGIAAAVMSVLAIIMPVFTTLLMDFVIVYLMAGWMIIGGITSIVEATKAKKTAENKFWVATLIWGILFLVFGIFGCFRPIMIAWMVEYLVGFLLIAAGVRLISTVFEKN